MDFRFVDNTAIDRPTRRQIRSHVMKGKNAGRTLKRGRAALRKRPQTENNADSPHLCHDGIDDSYRHFLLAGDHALKLYRISSFPHIAQFSRDNKTIVHQFFSIVIPKLDPSNYYSSMRQEDLMGMHCMMEDDIYFPPALTLMEAMCEFFHENMGPSTGALAQLSKIISQINRTLSGAEALSDHAISQVLNLALYEQLRKNSKGWQTHLDGLQRMVELRGGLQHLQHRRFIAQKICRSDIAFALSHGTSPRFEWDEPRLKTPKGFSSYSLDPAHLTGFDCLGDRMHGIALDVFHMCRALDSSERLSIDRSDFQDMLLSTCYRLLNIRDLSQSDLASHLDHGCHLALLSFITSVGFQLGNRLLFSPGLLYAELCNYLLTVNIERTPVDQMRLILWFIVVGRLSIMGFDDETWLLPILSRITTVMGILSWGQFRQRLVQFPWITDLYDVPAQKLWIRIETYTIPQCAQELLLPQSGVDKKKKDYDSRG